MANAIDDAKTLRASTRSAKEAVLKRRAVERTAAAKRVADLKRREEDARRQARRDRDARRRRQVICRGRVRDLIEARDGIRRAATVWNVAHANVAAWANEKSFPNQEHFDTIASAEKVSLDWLFGFTELRSAGNTHAETTGFRSDLVQQLRNSGLPAGAVSACIPSGAEFEPFLVERCKRYVNRQRSRIQQRSKKDIRKIVNAALADGNLLLSDELILHRLKRGDFFELLEKLSADLAKRLLEKVFESDAYEDDEWFDDVD